MDGYYMNCIEIKNLSYKYPTSDIDSLKNITLNIEAGKFYAIIGNNGSGKTTMCNLLRGFIPNFYNGDLRGEIKLDGTHMEEWTEGEIAQKVGFVFQNPFTQISGVKDTVFEEIAYGMENLGVPREEMRRRVEGIIELLGIEHLQDKNPNDMSGGQKQRVAFASIIVMEPDILVIDEPTSQLDPHGTEEIFKIIKIMKDKGKTIILVEHKSELIAEYADEIILMEDGELIAEGTTYDIFSNEALNEHGNAMPQYALLGLEMRNQGMNIPKIPTTQAEAEKIIGEWQKNNVVTSFSEY